MAKENFGAVQTFKAEADYSDYQYCPVYISSADTVTISGASGKVNGILLNKPTAAGRPAEVLTASGCFCKLRVDGVTPSAIAAGDPLEADASSMGIKLTIDGNGTTETYMIGWADEASGAVADGYITVLTNFAPTTK